MPIDWTTHHGGAALRNRPTPRTRPTGLAVAAGIVLVLCTACRADDLQAVERFSATVVAFELGQPYRNVTLDIVGPDDTHTSAFAASGAPAIDFAHGGTVTDGEYRYQLDASSPERVRTRSRLDDGRDAPVAELAKGVALSGVFRVKDGAIVPRDPAAREPRQQRN